MRVTRYGLYAAPAVQSLLIRERDVMQEVQAFAEDRGEPIINVAGPPDPTELRQARMRGDAAVPLPCIRLHMRKTTHHLTGDPMIEITCSDDDLVELECWSMRGRRSVAQRVAAPAH